MSVSSSRAVSMRTGTGRSRWMRRQTSSPSSPGSIRSSTTRSGRSRSHSATPAGPSWATSTAKPSARSRAATASAIASSSSMTQISGPPTPPSVPAADAGRVRVLCRYRAADAAAPDPPRDAASSSYAGRAAAARPDARSGRRARRRSPNTPNDRRNPLVELPEPAEAIVARAPTPCSSPTCTPTTSTRPRCALLAGDRPVLCQPPDAEPLRERGFTDVRPVEDALELDGMQVARTGGQHGTGEIAELLAPVSGFVLRADGRADRLRRRRHDLVRRGARRRSTSTRPTSSSSTRAARASPRATRSS